MGMRPGQLPVQVNCSETDWRPASDLESFAGDFDGLEQRLGLAHGLLPLAGGHGIGDELLQELIAKARAAGYERLSLSVEPGNPARKLYERHGFSVVDEGAEAWTMVASL